MKKIFSYLLLTAIAMLSFTACSDDDPTTPNTVSGDFFRMNVGSYWTYTTNDYDTLGAIDQTTTRYDSTVVTSSSTLWGKTAFNVSTFSTNESGAYEHDMDYAYASTDDQLFVSSTFLDFKDQLPFELNYDFPTDQWFLLADRKADTLDVLPTPITIPEQTLPIEIEGFSNIKLSGTYQIKVTRKDHTVETLFGNQLNVLNFELKNVITGTVKAGTIFGTQSLPIEISIIYNISFADRIGLIKQVLPNQSISVTLPGGMKQELYKVVGYQSIIKSYLNDLITTD